MAEPIADSALLAVDELRRKARRRLIGAIVLVLAAATLLPLLLEHDQKPLGDDVSVQIPPVDDSKFVTKLGGDKANEKGGSRLAEKPVEKAPEKIADAKPAAKVEPPPPTEP